MEDPMTTARSDLIEVLCSFWKKEGKKEADISILSSEECTIDEECDTYGFSLIDGSKQDSRSKIESFKSDANWNNPGAVHLMGLAFGIDKDNEYSSHIATLRPGPDYTTLRASHNRMVAQRYVEDGIKLKNKGAFVESLKRFDEAIKLDVRCFEAYQERGDVKIILGNRFDALQDLEKACKLQTNNESTKLEVSILRSSLGLNEVDNNMSDSQAKTINNSQDILRSGVVNNNLSIIDKLQQALGKNSDVSPSSSGSSGSSSSSSSSSDDSGDGDSTTNDGCGDGDCIQQDGRKVKEPKKKKARKSYKSSKLKKGANRESDDEDDRGSDRDPKKRRRKTKHKKQRERSSASGSKKSHKHKRKHESKHESKKRKRSKHE